MDTNTLKNSSTTQTWRGSDRDLAGTCRGHDGPKTGGCRREDRQVFPNDPNGIEPVNGKSLKNAHLDESKNVPYLQNRSDTKLPSTAETH